MTVAYDTYTAKGETTGDSTWDHTAGASNIQGALVYIVIRASNTPPVGVTYGGTAMTKVSEANDTGQETGNVTAWFLTSPGNGTKTVSVDVGSAQVWCGAAITCTGAAALKTYVGTPAQENQANPSATITVPANYVNYPSSAYFYGAVTAGTTAGSGYSEFFVVDFSGGGVSSSGQFERYSTGTVTGDPTVNWTAATDDCAAVFVTMGEPVTVAQAVAASTTVTVTPTRSIRKALASTTTVGTALARQVPRTIASTATFTLATIRSIGKPLATTSTVTAVTEASKTGTVTPVTIAIAGTPEGWTG